MSFAKDLSSSSFDGISLDLKAVRTSRKAAVEIIRDGRGSHFDPDMVDAFLVLSEEFRRIAQRFADGEPALLAQIDRLATDVPAERIEL